MSKLYVKYLLGFALVLIHLNTYSQSVESVLKVGDDLFDLGDYYGSVQFYKKALEIDSTNTEVLYKYARNLVKLNNHKGASHYYLKVVLIDKGYSYPEAYYYLAEAYRSSGEYRKAKRYYSKAIIKYRQDRESYWYKRINQSKDAANWANQNDNQKVAYPNNLGKSVNSSFSEFGSIVHEGKFYFSAMVADSVEANNIIKDKHYYSRIYVKSTSNQEEAVLLELDEKAKKVVANRHMANPTFYNNDMFFSLCDSNYKCEIWKAQIVNNQISNINKLNKNINNSSSTNTQPFLTSFKDDTYLFFVSDRELGLGGLDIWISKQEKFGFGKPINLGTSINTADNEICPHYDSKSKSLFFSSDWHLGFGGYDIFKSMGEPLSFQEPINLGYGINTVANDLYFSPMGKGATFTSNRREGNTENSSTCCNDLFEVSYVTDSLPEIDSSALVVNEVVLNKYLPLDLYFHNDQPNPNSRDTTTQENYLNLCDIYMKQEEEYLENYLKIIPNKSKQRLQAELETFFEEELEDGRDELEYFAPLLLKELQKGSQVVLTIKGYASSVSESAYNLNLTLRRIESLINYFKEYGAGVFIPYLDSTAADGGSLKFNKVPFGEFAVKQVLDEDDKITAIYSPQAARERKIELVALSSTDPKSSLNTEKQAIIAFNTKQITINEIGSDNFVVDGFVIANSGEVDLKIYNVSSNCDCLSIDYPDVIEKGTEVPLLVDVNLNGIEGKLDVQITVVSNTLNSINTLTLTLDKSN